MSIENIQLKELFDTEYPEWVPREYIKDYQPLIDKGLIKMTDQGDPESVLMEITDKGKAFQDLVKAQANML